MNKIMVSMTAMKRTIIILCLALVAMAARAQLNVGVKGTLNCVPRSSFFSDFWHDTYSGYQVGPIVKVIVSHTGFGFDVAALYNRANVMDDDILIKQRSIAFPVNIRCYPIRYVPVYIYAGPQLDLNVKQDKFSDKNAWETIKKSLSRDSQMSGNIGVGVTIFHVDLSCNYNLAFSSRGRFDLPEDFDDIRQVVYGNARASMWQFSATVYF